MCNLSCKHCYSNCSSDSQQELPLEVVVRLLKSLKEYDFDSVGFTGGEPLLHSAFTKIIDLTNELDIPVMLFTNLILINDNIVRHFKNNIMICTSLEGANEETNDYIRGKGSYKKFVKAINILKKFYINNVEVNLTVQAKNYLEIKDFIYMVKSWGYLPNLTFITYRGRAVEYWNELRLSMIETVKAKKFIVKYLGSNESNPYDTCPQFGHEELWVKSNGDVSLCCLLDNYIIGNIIHSSFDEITKNSFIQKNNLSKHNFKNCDECMNYYNKKVTDYQFNSGTSFIKNGRLV